MRLQYSKRLLFVNWKVVFTLDNPAPPAHPGLGELVKLLMGSCIPADVIAAASKRVEDIQKFLHEPEQQRLLERQAHLDAGSAERAYWHAGYASALQDLLAIIQKGARAA